jgi:hypothetical protein
MSTRQTAAINGLLAENLGKNDLVRNSEARANDAANRASDAEHSARFNQFKIDRLEAEAQKLKDENKMYRELLSRPMREIAEVSGDFRKTYFAQQQNIAEWIMSQRAYRETAVQLGIALDMTPEQVQKVAAPNYTAVLENRTQHGHDAKDTPLLAEYAATILAIRKKNGKA